MIEEKKLTIADQEAVKQIRRWPTLLGSSHDFFLDCIVGRSGSYSWVNGKLVHGDKNYKSVKGKPVKCEYPFQIPEKFAISLLNRNHDGFISVYGCPDAPINHIPDDVHPDWMDFISFHLFLDSKLTPELYHLIVQAHCIRHYGVLHNPNANFGSYEYEWKNYFAKIPSYQARVRLIREIQELGQIPPDRYMGENI